MRSVLALCLALAIGACGDSASPPQEAPGPTTDPGAEQARVVFVRPSGFAQGQDATILDGKARVVGRIGSRSRFAVDLPPGEHTFVVWDPGAQALKARLAAGKTYYVEVSAGVGMWAARFALEAIRPSSEPGQGLREWLAATELVDRNADEAQQQADDRPEEVQEVVREGLRNWAGYDDETRRKHSLQPEDGS